MAFESCNMKAIGKLCEGEPHTQFDEGVLETGRWRELHGHKAGNGGNRQVQPCTLPRQCSTLPLIVCQRDGYQALKRFKEIAERLDLKLNQSKTKVTRLTEGFDFVGYNFVKRKSPTSDKNTIYLFPTKASEQKIRNSIKYKTSWRAPIKPEEFVRQVNVMVKGWTNYYLHTNASQAFRRLQRFINIRFRRYLHRRRKGHGYGWKHYPNRKLYERGIIYIGSGLLKYQPKPVNGLR